jgi:hypothetical protein
MEEIGRWTIQRRKQRQLLTGHGATYHVRTLNNLRQIEELIVAKVEESGGKMQDVKGWEDWHPATENSLKRDHLLSIRNSIGEFAQIIGTKDFLLAEPAEGRSFYLGDNPVCLNNMHKTDPYGNLGLGVTGIEIYMPLASNLLRSTPMSR